MITFLILVNLALIGVLGTLYYIVLNHLRNHRIANQWRKLYEAEQERQRHAERMETWERLNKLENKTPGDIRITPVRRG